MAGRGMMYAKMGGVALAGIIGVPLLMYYTVPSEGEVYKRWSPELQERNARLRDERMKNYEEFLQQLKENSKSDKNIWVAAQEKEAQRREESVRREREEFAAKERMREEMRAETQGR